MLSLHPCGVKEAIVCFLQPPTAEYKQRFSVAFQSTYLFLTIYCGTERRNINRHTPEHVHNTRPDLLPARPTARPHGRRPARPSDGMVGVATRWYYVVLVILKVSGDSITYFGHTGCVADRVVGGTWNNDFLSLLTTSDGRRRQWLWWW